MIDTHVHLDDERLIDKADDIIAGFKQENIDFVINASCDLATMQNGINLANNYKEVFATIGMHPHTANQFDNNFKNAMTTFATEKRVVAVGEIGLDYHYDLSDRKIQRDVFAEQLEMANKYALPVVLHIRDAYGDASDILNAQKRYLNNGVLWHCYSGSEEFAKQYVKLGHYFAFGGAITFKNAKKENIIKSIPTELVLSETDCPYMSPEPFRGKTNIPQYVTYVVNKLASVYGITIQEMEDIILRNAKMLFKKLE